MKWMSRNEVIDGLLYDTDTATLLADDNYWDGHNFEHHGTNTYLFRGPGGRYFKQIRSQWEGADDGALETLTDAEAQALYEGLREKRVLFQEAFPNVQVQDA